MENENTQYRHLVYLAAIIFTMFYFDITKRLEFIFLSCIFCSFFHYAIFPGISMGFTRKYCIQLGCFLTIARLAVIAILLPVVGATTLIQTECVLCLFGFFLSLGVAASASLKDETIKETQSLNPELSKKELKANGIKNKKLLLQEFNDIYDNLIVVLKQPHQIGLSKLVSKEFEAKLKSENFEKTLVLENFKLTYIKNLRITAIKNIEDNKIIKVEGTLKMSGLQDYFPIVIIFKENNDPENKTTNWIIEDMKFI